MRFFLVQPEEIDEALKSAVLAFGWAPKDFKGLYLDRRDYLGLFYWYDVAEDLNNKLGGKK